MIKTVTVRQTGASIAATIPKEMAERQHIAVGDTLFAIETQDGVLLTPYDPIIERGAEAYDRIAKRYRGTLRALSR